MSVKLKRRDFLTLSGSFLLAAGLPFKGGCGGGGGPAAGVYRFPQGLASGDPRQTSVVLWTRIEAVAGGTEPIDFNVQVSTDENFDTVVAEQAVQATSAADFTVRVLVTSLTPGTTYHYRFVAGGDEIVGRTFTAPDASADVPVNLAWVSCQDYEAGNYVAYQTLIAEDEARPAADRITFVVHLGDNIYETRGTQFQVPLDANFQPLAGGRTMPAFPTSTSSHAESLADYRHLYKVYLADPNLRAARARWPFIYTWDDHEFTNDAWQSQANYTDEATLDEPAATRKVAANQAWFEFTPAQLTGAPGVTGVTQDAKDFQAVTVTNAAFGTAVDDSGFYTETNNAAAVSSMTIYRSFRFGAHLELMMTDQRSYRSDHAIPESPDFGAPLLFDERNALPMEFVNVFDAGRTANGGSPPAIVLGKDNPRTMAPPGSMLGAEQKAWMKASLAGSNATWKLWGNPVPMMRVKIKPGPVAALAVDRVLNGDGWDGYPGERNEMLTYLRTQDIKNVLVITGDWHAHFAATLMDNYDAASPMPVGVEFIAAGITSNSLFSFFEFATRAFNGTTLRDVITFDGSSAGLGNFVENMNVLCMHGATAALNFKDTKNLATALGMSDATQNPHLKYADTNAQGYGTLTITSTQTTARLVTVERPVAGTGAVKRVAAFTVPKDNPAGMTGPTFTGTKPVPY